MTKFKKMQFPGALIVSAVCFFAFLGSYALMNTNEGVYAGISRRLMETGNYIVPRLNGLIYLEKPPMIYWLTALNFNLFGINEWSARLAPALAGFLIGLLLFGFLRHQDRKKDAVWALLIWSSSIGAISCSRVILCDMVLTMFLSVLLVSLYIYRQNRDQQGWLYVGYAMAACALLTKGLLGVALAGMTMFVYIYSEQSEHRLFSFKRFGSAVKEMFSFFSVIGTVIFLAIALPWHIAVAQHDPNFWYYYFVNEQFLRFMNAREPHDYYNGPIYYYVVRLFGLMLPWVFFLPAFIWREKSQDLPRKEQSLERFCWSWFLAILVFFSINRAKDHYYIITGMPPLIILFTLRMRQAKEFIYKKLVFSIFSVLFCMLPLSLLAVWFAPQFLGKLAESHRWAAYLYAEILPVTDYLEHLVLPVSIAIAACMIGLFVIWYARKHQNIRDYYVWTLAVFIAVLTTTTVSKFYLFENNYSAKNIIAEITEKYDKENIDLYMYRDFEKISTTPYYFERPVIVIKSESMDLLYGMNKPDSKPYKITLEDFLKLPTKRPIFVVMEKPHLEDFQEISAQAGFKMWKDYGHRGVFYRDRCIEN
ncbi:glycosyltransferase family 39 protein [Lentisphaerota bacterium ZTH]|nr:glycosyltransferase family 39 protein [Lentisphaerota bacterium]WET07500.1 glycosyltransferase family 39 protein [Lentisphaerota bacterium ZTH]